MFGDPVNSKENRIQSLEQRVKALEKEQYPVSLRCQAVKLEWLERAVFAILAHLGLKFVQQRDVLVPDGETGTTHSTKLTH